MLLLGALLMVGAGVLFALTGNFLLLLLAAIIGVIKPRGKRSRSLLAHRTGRSDADCARGGEDPGLCLV